MYAKDCDFHVVIVQLSKTVLYIVYLIYRYLMLIWIAK